MNIRNYINQKDYKHLSSWINNERIHALWCANRIPYPITEENLNHLLLTFQEASGQCAYTVTDESDIPIGFFIYIVDVAEKTGFLKFIMLNNEIRGRGYGTQMLALALNYAFEKTGVLSVSLNVFDINYGAKKCYQKLGFIENSILKDAFSFQDEKWARCHMTVTKTAYLKRGDV